MGRKKHSFELIKGLLSLVEWIAREWMIGLKAWVLDAEAAAFRGGVGHGIGASELQG